MSFLIPCTREAKKVMKDKDGSREDLGYLLIIIGVAILFSVFLLEVVIPRIANWWLG